MKNVILVFILLSSFSLLAQDLRGDFFLGETNNSFKEGDVLSGVIRLWPLEKESSLKQIKELEGRVFFNSLKLLNIDEVKTSENNSDVVEVFGTFVASGSVVNPQGHLRFSDQNIQLTLKNVDVSELKEKADTFFVEEQSVLKKTIFKFLLGSLIVVFLACLLFKNKIQAFVAKLTKSELKKKIAGYNKIMSQAKNREDFENIYLMREELKSSFRSQDGFEKFLMALNKIQFKENWSNEDLSLIRSEFSKIKWSFK